MAEVLLPERPLDTEPAQGADGGGGCVALPVEAPTEETSGTGSRLQLEVPQPQLLLLHSQAGSQTPRIGSSPVSDRAGTPAGSTSSGQIVGESPWDVAELSLPEHYQAGAEAAAGPPWNALSPEDVKGSFDSSPKNNLMMTPLACERGQEADAGEIKREAEVYFIGTPSSSGALVNKLNSEEKVLSNLEQRLREVSSGTVGPSSLCGSYPASLERGPQEWLSSPRDALKSPREPPPAAAPKMKPPSRGEEPSRGPARGCPRGSNSGQMQKVVQSQPRSSAVPGAAQGSTPDLRFGQRSARRAALRKEAQSPERPKDQELSQESPRPVTSPRPRARSSRSTSAVSKGTGKRPEKKDPEEVAAIPLRKPAPVPVAGSDVKRSGSSSRLMAPKAAATNQAKQRFEAAKAAPPAARTSPPPRPRSRPCDARVAEPVPAQGVTRSSPRLAPSMASTLGGPSGLLALVSRLAPARGDEDEGFRAVRGSSPPPPFAGEDFKPRDWVSALRGSADAPVPPSLGPGRAATPTAVGRKQGAGYSNRAWSPVGASPPRWQPLAAALEEERKTSPRRRAVVPPPPATLVGGSSPT